MVRIDAFQGTEEFMMPGDQSAAERGVVIVICLQLSGIVRHMEFPGKFHRCFFSQIVIQFLIEPGAENPDSQPEQGGQ